METIVLGFDGRGPSNVALDWVADRATRGTARVEIVMIAGSIFSDDFRIDESLVRAENRLRGRAPDAEVSSHRFAGRMPQSLFEHARQSDLIVVGSHRGRPRTALPRRLPLQIVSRSVIPVVIVPDDWAPNEGPVVLGLDDDDSSLAALDFAAGESDATAATLAVVHAWQMPIPRIEGSVALLASPIQVKADHRRILRVAARHVADGHPELLVEQFLVHGNPTAALLERAPTSSLLVLGTHGRGRLAGAFMGSVAEDVLWQCPIPVCVVPLDRAT